MTENLPIYHEILEEVDQMGVDIFGIASAQEYCQLYPQLPSPKLFVPNARSIILIGQIIEPSTMRTVLHPELANAPFLHTQNSSLGSLRNINPQKYFMIEETEIIKIELSRIGKAISRRLRKAGFDAMNMPVCKRDAYTHKPPFYFAPAFYLAGLGTKGLNGTMIHPEFGSRFYISVVISECDLPTGRPLGENLCTHCNLCVRACPLGAVHEDGSFNASDCIEYDNCSTCIAVCPVGKVRPFSPAEVIRWLKEDKPIWSLQDKRDNSVK